MVAEFPGGGPALALICGDKAKLELYGWIFYPLFRLGEEQLYRVLETAAKFRYREAGGTMNRPRYFEVIDFMIVGSLERRGSIALHDPQLHQ